MKLSCLLLIPFIFLAGGCRHQHLPYPPKTTVEKLVFGTFYGECAVNCVNLYSVDRSVLQKSDNAPYPSLSLSYRFIPARTLSYDKFKIAKDLLYQVPKELLSDNNRTFGAPDSHDQGGIYIEIYQGKTPQRFMIDMDNTADQSAELIVFKQKVSDIMAQLR